MRYVGFLILILAGVLVPSSAATQTTQGIAPLEAPGTLEQAKEGVLGVGDEIAQGLFGIFPAIWRNEVVPAWKSMWQWTKELFGEEKQEIKEELTEQGKKAPKSLPRVKAGLWERFLALFREEE